MPFYAKDKVTGEEHLVEDDIDTTTGVNKAMEGLKDDYQIGHYLVANQESTEPGTRVFVPQNELSDALKSGAFDLETDPNKKYEEKFSPLEAGLHGAAKEVSFDFADEIAGGVGALKGNKYVEARDKYREQQRLAEEQNPGSFRAGQAAGIGASLLIPGGAVAKGASTSAKIGRGVLSGAVQGALQGTGEAKEMADVQSKAVKGALVGGVLGGAIPAGMAGISAIKKGSSEVADEAAYRVLGGTKTDLPKKAQGMTPEDIGSTLREEKLIDGTTKTAGKDLRAKVSSRVKDLAEEQKKIIGSADTAEKRIDLNNVVESLKKYYEKVSEMPGVDNETQAKAIMNEIESLNRFSQKNPEITFKEAVDVKSGYNGAGKFSSKTEAAQVEAARKVRSKINDYIDDEVENVLGTAQREAYKAVRKKMSHLMKAVEVMESTKGSKGGNRKLSLTDFTFAPTLAAVGASAAGPVGAAALPVVGIAGKKAVENYGPAMLSKVAGDTSKVLNSAKLNAMVDKFTKMGFNRDKAIKAIIAAGYSIGEDE